MALTRATRVANAHIAVAVDGDGINEGIIDGVDEAGKEMDSKGQQHGEQYGDGFGDGALDRIRDNLAKGLAHYGFDRDGDKAGTDFGDAMIERLRQRLDGAHDLVEGLTRRLFDADDDDIPLLTVLTHGLRTAQNEATILERQLRTLLKEQGRLPDVVPGEGGGRGRGRDEAGLGDTIGGLFGAGSRNNFLNLIGKTIGNVVGLVEKGANFAGTFATNMAKAGEGASLFARVGAGFSGSGGGIASMFLKLGASLPVIVVGLGAVTLVMSALVSVASALLGIVVALASTIASALVASLAIGAGALGALAVAAGLTTLAFTSMTEAQSKTLRNAFQPLKAEATGLGQILLRELVPAFSTWSDNLQRALLLAAPLAQVMSGALASAGNILTASLSGGGVQLLVRVLGETLPGIVVNLSKAFGGFLNGVSGVFAALLPYVLRFTEYLARVADNFARWAASARGQNEIKDFIDRAIESLKSFWGFLKAVGGLLSTLLFNPQGQKTGNNIFDNMAKDLRKFTDYISKEDRLEKWFKDAEEFAHTLGSTIRGITKLLNKLDDSTVLAGIIKIADAFESAASWASKAKGFIEDLPIPLENLVSPINVLIDGFRELLDLMGLASDWTPPANIQPGPLTDALSQTAQTFGGNGYGFIGPVISPNVSGNNSDLQDLIDSGNEALNNTYESNGGYMPDPTDPAKGPKFTTFEGGPVIEDWINPYVAFAASLVKQTESMADQIRKAAREARKAIADAMADATEMFSALFADTSKSFLAGIGDAVVSTDYKAIQQSFNALLEGASAAALTGFSNAAASAQGVIDSAQATRASMIAQAESAYAAAAQALASVTNPKDVKAAQKALQKAGEDLNLARQKGDQLVRDARISADKMIADANAGVNRVAAANAILAAQGVFTFENALNLINGIKVENATLSDYAEARRWVAESLAMANQKLADALAIRDNYSNQIAESIRTFGSLLGAQAKVINGVQQALTTGDIVESMQARLAKVKAFQENLRLLLAQGLSDAAYKQLVDAGVENGGAYAQALVEGGQGGISEVNALTEQFNALGEELGLAASSQMYQAGVDAAQGLVDGLTSLSEELDSAAAALGEAIAAAIKRELGIASPSRVLMAMMDDVGDGAVVGLDNQHDKVGAASARLSEQIAVSPEVAAYAATQSERAATTNPDDEVSGNAEGTAYAGKIRDLHVHTPTEDPHAVATEVIDELTGQL